MRDAGLARVSALEGSEVILEPQEGRLDSLWGGSLGRLRWVGSCSGMRNRWGKKHMLVTGVI